MLAERMKITGLYVKHRIDHLVTNPKVENVYLDRSLAGVSENCVFLYVCIDL